MWTASYWKQLLESALTAGAATAATVWGAEAFDVFNADWKAGIGLGLGAAVLKVLYGLGVAGTGTPNTPSAVKQDTFVEA